MRDSKRIEPLLDDIKKLWEENPDLRLGQLLSVLCSMHSVDIFYVEDDRLQNMIRNGLTAPTGKKNLQQEQTVRKKLTCPVCKTKMEVQTLDDYVCPRCGTKKINGQWADIPEKHRASEKQIRTAKFIEHYLYKEIPPPTKQLLWSFINDYFEEAKKVAEQIKASDMEAYCEDCWEYIPPYDEFV